MRMGKTPKPPEAVVLDADDAAREFRLPVAKAAILVGSGVRVGMLWLEDYRARKQLDFTIADCAMLTGTPVNTLLNWRQSGLLKVRATSRRLTSRLLVAPAELVRVL